MNTYGEMRDYVWKYQLSGADGVPSQVGLLRAWLDVDGIARICHWLRRNPGGLDGMGECLKCEHGIENLNDLPLTEVAKLLSGENGTAKQQTPNGDNSSSMSLVRVSEIWHFLFNGEKGNYPVNGNKFIGWLAKLLQKPNHVWTVPELYGDPEGKLAADAKMGGENTIDKEGMQRIRNRLEEIEETIKEVGVSETLQNEKEKLLQQYEQEDKHPGRMKTTVGKAYNNISTQKRQFLEKLEEDMPELAAHLKVSIKQDGKTYSFCYRPPTSTSWKIEENPTK